VPDGFACFSSAVTFILASLLGFVCALPLLLCELLPLDAPPLDFDNLTDAELLAWVDVHFLVHPYYMGRYAKRVCQSDFMVTMMDNYDAGTCVWSVVRIVCLTSLSLPAWSCSV
jgi:hypothetical protein